MEWSVGFQYPTDHNKKKNICVLEKSLNQCRKN